MPLRKPKCDQRERPSSSPPRHQPLGDVAKTKLLFCSSEKLMHSSSSSSSSFFPLPPPPPPPPLHQRSRLCGRIRMSPVTSTFCYHLLTLCLRRWKHFAPPVARREVPFARRALERGERVPHLSTRRSLKTPIDRHHTDERIGTGKLDCWML